MARRTRVEMVDDIDGSTDDVQTVKFGYEGFSYEIDLGPKNREELAELLAPFVKNAQRSGRASSTRGGRGEVSYTLQEGRAARAWAQTDEGAAALTEAGIPVPSGRGRLRLSVVEAWRRSRP